MTAPEIVFTRLAPAHLDLLHCWLQQPHVREFWDDGHRTREQVQAHYFGPDAFNPDALNTDPANASFVFTLAGRPAGYLQTYRVELSSEYAQWRSPHGETWGLDLLLGAATDTGQGHGPQIIRAFMKLWQGLHPDLSRLLIDPDIRNIRAIRAYQKAGFSSVGELARPAAALRILACNL